MSQKDTPTQFYLSSKQQGYKKLMFSFLAPGVTTETLTSAIQQKFFPNSSEIVEVEQEWKLFSEYLILGFEDSSLVSQILKEPSTLGGLAEVCWEFLGQETINQFVDTFKGRTVYISGIPLTTPLSTIVGTIEKHCRYDSVYVPKTGGKINKHFGYIVLKTLPEKEELLAKRKLKEKGYKLSVKILKEKDTEKMKIRFEELHAMVKNTGNKGSKPAVVAERQRQKENSGSSSKDGLHVGIPVMAQRRKPEHGRDRNSSGSGGNSGDFRRRDQPYRHDYEEDFLMLGMNPIGRSGPNKSRNRQQQGARMEQKKSTGQDLYQQQQGINSFHQRRYNREGSGRPEYPSNRPGNQQENYYHNNERQNNWNRDKKHGNQNQARKTRVSIHIDWAKGGEEKRERLSQILNMNNLIRRNHHRCNLESNQGGFRLAGSGNWLVARNLRSNKLVGISMASDGSSNHPEASEGSVMLSGGFQVEVRRATTNSAPYQRRFF